MAHFYNRQWTPNWWHVFAAALKADHLTSGQKVVRVLAFALVFVLMALPLMWDLLS